MDQWLLRTICITGIALIVIACVLWNIRQRRLREVYAVIWLVFGGGLLLLGFFPQLIFALAAWSGIYYLTLFLLFFFICLFIFILQISIVLSSHTDANCKLTQEAAIANDEIVNLKSRIELLQQRIDTIERVESDNEVDGDSVKSDNKPGMANE